jgi:hypothetical protein
MPGLNPAHRLARALAVVCLGLVCAAALVASEHEMKDAYEFALIGDYPYTGRDERGMPNLVRDIRRQTDLAFVVHLGDLHNPRMTDCSEELFRARHDLLMDLQHPLIYTPGDNDWADCKEQPEHYLQLIRNIFFADPQRSNGVNAFAVRSQGSGDEFPELVENVMWEYQGVVYASMHMLLPALLPFGDEVADYRQRLIRAGEAWMDEAFAMAAERDAKAVFLFTQASLWPISGNPQLINLLYPELLELTPTFDQFRLKLVEHVRAFKKPVVMANGDTHYFRIDKPLLDAGNDPLQTFTRVEGFGTPHGHWVRVRVEPGRPEVFSFRQELVEENLFTLVAPGDRPDEDVENLDHLVALVAVMRWIPRIFMWIGVLVVILWIVKAIRRRRRRKPS